MADKKETLTNVITHTINNNDDLARKEFGEYLQTKMADVLADLTKNDSQPLIKKKIQKS
jgi:hypothetical protein